MPTKLVSLDYRVGLKAVGVTHEQLLAKLEAETARRSIVSHVPAYAIKFSSKAKYVYVARDGRDVVWSMYAFF